MIALPNSEVVVTAWLRAAVPYLGGAVATSLPAEGWHDNGFVTVATIGGTPENYVGWRMPLVSLDFWGMAPNSGRPPWNLAAQLAERTREAILTHGLVGRPVELPPAYSPARVESVMMRTEPRRAPGDVANYAHYTMDVEFRWKVL